MSDNIIVTGVVGSDPKHTQGNTDRTQFRLASTQRKFDKTENKWVDVNTNWYTVTAFRQLANNVAASIEKGQRIIVAGRLEVREYDKADGTKGTNVEIVAESIGHDLFWGTATFTKGTSGQTASAGAATSDPWANTATAWDAPTEEAPF